MQSILQCAFAAYTSHSYSANELRHAGSVAHGAVSQLPLPPGETLGDANSVNASSVAVGSVDAGSLQQGAIYSGGSGTIITQTTANDSFFVTAFGINDSGRVVGQGIDPMNATRNVGIVYDIGQNMAFEVGAGRG